MSADFYRYWESWGTALKTIVTSRSAKLHFPPAQLRVKEGGMATSIQFEEPICIFNSPSKASSNKAGKAISIFIKGEFEFSKADNQMRHSSCAISFFSQKSEGNQIKLTLTEAMHFDTEKLDDQKAFHPIFHVQRGEGIDLDACKNVIRHITKKELADITVESVGHKDNVLLHNPYFRIPTPQMDLLSVITLVVADFFCGSGPQDRASSEKHFQSILSLLVAQKNPAREGACATQLRGHFADSHHMSTGNWYLKYKT